MSRVGDAASIVCPDCGAAVGEWCRRHDQVMPSPLLACPARSRAVMLCFVGVLADDPHIVGPDAKTVTMFIPSAREARVCAACAALSEGAVL